MISKEKVSEYISSNFNVIGVNALKKPSEGSWSKHMKILREPKEINSWGLAIICGAVSSVDGKALECIDIDLKHDLTKTLYTRYRDKVNKRDPDLLDKLTIIRTVSKGYHWIYRCEKIQGNKKLAVRTAGPKEDPDEKPVLIETRGERGYIVSEPSPGYKKIQGTYSKLATISTEEREILLSCAREFNEVTEKIAKTPQSDLRNTFNVPEQSENLTSWDAYDARAKIPDILTDAGWTKTRQSGDREYYKRPGVSTSQDSGNYSTVHNTFTCFSSSTVLDPEKAYHPFPLYTALMHNNDFRASARQLYSEGFGNLSSKQKESGAEYAENRYSENSKVGEQVTEVDVSMFLSDYESDYAYLKSVRAGTVEKGLSTGSLKIDKFLLFKPASYIVAIGHTNVGKSLTLLWLTMIAALNHNWKIIVIAKENASHDFKLKLAEFYLQKPLQESTIEEFEEASKWISDHYTFIKGRGGYIRSMTDALKLLYKLTDEQKYNCVLLDPYSGFDQDKLPGESAHEMDTRFNSELLDFTEKTKVSVILSVHTVTSSRREKDENGYMKRPHLDSGSGGATFSNRPDSVWVIHRIINHEDMAERFTTQLYVDKDRQLELGGMISPQDEPIKLLLRDKKFFVDCKEDIIYNIKNKNKNDDHGKNISIYDQDMPF